MLEQARQRFSGNPWVQQVLESMAELARERDTARFGKEAMFCMRRMNSRLAAKEEALSLRQEAEAPAYLRRKAAQGKAQYRVARRMTIPPPTPDL